MMWYEMWHFGWRPTSHLWHWNLLFSPHWFAHRCSLLIGTSQWSLLSYLIVHNGFAGLRPWFGGLPCDESKLLAMKRLKTNKESVSLVHPFFRVSNQPFTTETSTKYANMGHHHFFIHIRVCKFATAWSHLSTPTIYLF